MSGSFGGSRESAKTFSETQNDLPAWLKEAYQQNLQRAQKLADQPFEAYGGPLTAADNDLLGSGRYQAMQSVTAGQDATNSATANLGYLSTKTPSWLIAAPTQATSLVGDVIDVNPERAQAGTVGQANLSQYLNPYQSSVIDRSNQAIDRSRQLMDDQNAYAASQAGAFGGSRHGVLDSENARNFAQMQQENTNSLLDQGYDRAMGLASSDLDRLAATSQFNAAQGNAAQTQNANLDYQARYNDAQMLNQAAGANADREYSARMANQNYSLSSDAQRLAANQALLGAGQQQQQMMLNGANALYGAGQNLYDQEQAGINAAYQEFLRKQQDPFLRQQMLNSAVFGIDQGGLTSTTSSGKSSGTKIGGGVSKTF